MVALNAISASVGMFLINKNSGQALALMLRILILHVSAATPPHVS